MAYPKEEIWGAPSDWIYSKQAAGLESTAAKLGDCDKPKTADFGGTDNYYRGSLNRAVNNGYMVLNEYLDESICPCGQAPEVSPYAKIAIFNKSDDLSTSPEIQEIHDANINWFLADRASQSPANNAYWYSKEDVYNTDGNEYQQFAPGAHTPNSSTNSCMKLCPYTYWGLKSLILYIEIITVDKGATQYSNTHRRTLNEWKNQYNMTEDMCGLHLFAANCTSINSSTLALTYNTSSSISSGQANYVGVTRLINMGGLQGTQFLSIFSKSQNERAITIFDRTTDIYNYNDGRRGRAVLPCANYFKDQAIVRYKYGSDPHAYYFYTIPYSDDTYNKIMKIAALYGCYFTPVSKSDKNVWPNDMLDDDLYLPILDSNGVAHGQYTHGTANAENPLYSKHSIRDIDYDPSAPVTPVDPNEYSNTTGFNSITAGASATIKYVLDSSNVRQLLTDLWTISHNIAGADYENYDYKILDSFLVSNPIDSIVSLKRFPFDIPHTFSNQKTNVCLGKNTGSSEGYITHNVFNTVVFSGKRIYPKFGGSFLDYSPYTEYELYIPFCGTVKLNAGDILGHVLNCRLRIDLTIGTCTAYIMADDLVIETATGVVSCELQVAGTDSATVDSNIQNAVLDHIGARTNKEVSLLSPLSVGGLMSAAANPWKASASTTNAQTEVDRAEYALTHIQTPVHSMGNAGGLTGWYQEFNARIIIYYPEGEAIDSSAPVSSTSPHLADLSAYAHNVGFACVMNGTVSEFHGKTVGNIDTSSIVGATEEERAQIKALFARGVWLP